MTPQTILIVDDEEDLARVIAYNLDKEGYHTLQAHTGPDGLRVALEAKPGLVVLDLMLPGMSGLEVCRALRAKPAGKTLPIIMLSAKSEEVDKVLGLEMGADDYMAKPFSVKELIARIRALLRRTGASSPQEDSIITLGPLEIAKSSFTVSISGKPVAMSATEYKILLHLVQNKGRVLSRDNILDAVWRGESNVEPRTVDVHIKKIRSLIEPDPANPSIILTRRGLGYMVPETL